jgi:signal transduction histidine kinase
VAAPALGRATELQRFENTFNLARVGGAILAFGLGPFFPHLGLAYVVGLGVALLADAAFAAALIQTGRYRQFPEVSARLVFGVDLVVVAYAILVFAADPNWSTYIIGMLLVIAGGFRLATAGAIVASVTMAAAYVGIALYRASAFGFTTELYRLVFTVAIYLLAGFLMSGLVRELATLRAQRERFEHQRAEADALRHLDELKSQFLADMSHDFRSPLTVVRGAIEILRSERPGPLNVQQRELASRAARNAHRLEEFTEDLLEMARIEHGGVELERVEIDACALLREVVEDHRAFADAREQRIELDCQSDHMTISVDVGRLRRALSNLIDNAIKFGPEGSPISVCARREAEVFSVSVTDRGPGVDRDERDRIFDKFSRGRRSTTTSGAGLGLSIARSLVELHGGSIRYEDPSEGGATFVVTVPVGIE